MDMLSKRKGGHIVYLDECNVFTIAHAQAHGITKIQSQWEDYMKRLRKLDAKVIFLNIPPHISWERRRLKYEERLVYFPKKDHRRILLAFERYLHEVHPRLEEIYDRLPIPKRMIDAQQSDTSVIYQINQALTELSPAFR